MDNKGKGPLSVLLIVLIILAASLAALVGYSRLTAGSEDPYNIQSGVAGISADDKVGVYDKEGNFTELPDNVVVPGINTFQMKLVAEALEKTKIGLSEKITTPTPDEPPVTGDPAVTGTDPVTVTDIPGGSGEDDPDQIDDSDIERAAERAAENASLLLAYHENKEKLIEMLGIRSEEGGTAANGGDDKETVEFLSIYTQGTDDKSVALIQERLMQLGFMDFAEPTEHYGPVTMDAVKRFQRQNDLKQDGIIGEQTIGILFEDNAKSYLLKKGMDGDDIRNVQDRLYELGYLAKKDQITGHFGDDTDAAVKALQSANKLTSDGKIGVETFELLYSENVKANLISFGDKSDIVLECQKRLKELGYLTTTPDGYYGEDTLAAVKLFQSRNDCIVDGYLGPSTRAVLISSSAKANGLVLGDQNDTVKKVQKLLIKYGYLASGSDTGYFGELTEAAVKKFQKNNGLSADGNVGQKTMSVLTGSNVVKANGGGNGGGGNGGGGKENGDGKENGGGGGGTVSYSCSPDDLIAVARTKLGCKYVYGSKGPNTFDCSGFVYWCLQQIGVNQSYITSSGWRTVGKYKKITDFSKMKKGDIIVVYGHVGIAISNSRVIDASSSNGKIIERDMGDWWKRNFICAWRIFDE